MSRKHKKHAGKYPTLYGQADSLQQAIATAILGVNFSVSAAAVLLGIHNGT
ncbi:MAG: hypothetical protein WC429_19930 [Verrucomicrobiia bacterium]